MKIKNIITIIIISVLIIFPIEALQPETSCTAVDFYSESESLIEKCSINCYSSDGTLKIIAKTRASGSMEKIGFNNIIIQKSYDLQNWTDEKNLGDFIENNKIYCTLSTSSDITGGYYYRAICTHYAEGLPFRSDKSEIQTAENISKSVWIDAIPAPITSETTITTTIITTSTKKSSVIETSAVTSTASTSSKHTTTTTTTINTSSVTTTNNNKSPYTGTKIPLTVFFTAVISAVTALLSRKKHE
ncbi:MAG: hypothetical protein K2O60_02545 [Ruminococcus sp.]|nr:hypothetical protein [Ruminococcus sp.]